MFNSEDKMFADAFYDKLVRYAVPGEIDINLVSSFTDFGEVTMRRDYDYRHEVLKTSKPLMKHCEDIIMSGKVDDETFMDAIDALWDLRLMEARNRQLDSYLLYLEKNRDPSEKFYQPKRKQFLKMGIIQALQQMLDDELDVLSISMPPGIGKCQPLYSKVLTPTGFVQMKDIDVGSIVMTADGKPVKVLTTSKVHRRPIYEITFDDGSKVRASDNHLWKVQTRDDRTRGNKYRIVETQDMLKNVMVENGRRCNYSLDYVNKIDFPQKDFIIHPYVMGVILGDGGLTGGNIRVSTPDKKIIDSLNNLLPDGYSMAHVDRYDYRVKGHEGNNAKQGSLVRKELKRYDLMGKGSIYKFIPKDYMYASYEQRLWLLRGLMDTDGSAGSSCCSYSTSSPQLAEDVAELIRSLGGYVSINKKKAGYKKDGVYIPCHDSYNLCICFGAEKDNVFSLSRKRDKYNPKRPVLKRFIKSIDYVGEEDCKCILIDDPSHLYITDNYTITHNTTLEKFFVSAVMGWFPKKFNLFFSHSSDITRMFYDGVLNIVTDATEYTWRDIFPKLKISQQNAKLQQFNVGSYKPFPSLQCTSVGAENAGKVRANNFLLVDDLIGKLEEALNKNTLDKLWGVYSVDARQRKVDGCKEIHVATRWSVHDVIGRLQNIYKGNDRCKFIAIPDIDPVTGKSNFDYDYNGFTEEFFHDQELLMDDISYRCLYKNQPIEREGLLYHEDELRRFLDLPMEEPDAIIGICDTKSKGTDYMFLPCCYQYGDDFYCVDCICTDSVDYGVQYNRIANLLVDHNMQQCEFESNAGGDRVAYEVDKLVTVLGGRCNITTKPTETNKETRIIVNADWVKKHVLFKDKSLFSKKSDYGIMMSWLLSWSVAGRNTHDDVPDGWANFALFVNRGLRRRRTQIRRSPI